MHINYNKSFYLQKIASVLPSEKQAVSLGQFSKLQIEREFIKRIGTTYVYHK